jgi:hypothetical protein
MGFVRQLSVVCQEVREESFTNYKQDESRSLVYDVEALFTNHLMVLCSKGKVLSD